ncbi:uncharacterized protein TNCV_4866911 [Trichonephila clavipes]|nr:uncharacterized protein TNCV_4866911 [Trichonephila clavipes]
MNTCVINLNNCRTSEEVTTVIRAIEKIDTQLREFLFNRPEDQSSNLRQLGDVLDEAKFKFTHIRKQEIAEQNKLLQAQIHAWGLPSKPVDAPFQVILSKKKGRRNSGDNGLDSKKAKTSDIIETQNQLSGLLINNEDTMDVVDPQEGTSSATRVVIIYRFWNSGAACKQKWVEVPPRSEPGRWFVIDKASNTGIITDEKIFKTKNNIILTQTNIGELYNSIVDKLLAETADFQEKESGWTLDSIMYLEIRINKFNPLRASLFIDLPEIIKKKHAVINVQNHDNFCFKWAVLSALFPVNDNAHRVQQYETYFNTLDFTGINFPTPLKDIAKFEKVNEISINVYGLNEENKVFPLLITKAEKINMLTCCI